MFRAINDLVESHLRHYHESKHILSIPSEFDEAGGGAASSLQAVSMYTMLVPQRFFINFFYE